MKTFELRIYTLKSAEAAKAYVDVWLKHVESLKTFGIVTHGVFTNPADPTKLIALVNYADGDDAQTVTDRYMASDLFKADIAAFDMADFSSVETTLLSPTTFSPLQ